ncbi:serine/threonine protein kinase [bacterium]|nr:serine/threonine protein kinase [bacterium]
MSQHERTPLAPGTPLHQGRYTIQSAIAMAGFAITYKASEGRFPVCIKEFFPRGCQRDADNQVHTQDQALYRNGFKSFLDEAAALSRFRHPGIVLVLNTFEENGTVYIVEELLDGVTLGAGLSLGVKLREHDLLPLAHQIGQALLMMHGAGLVHADLKPDNIFHCRDGRCVLLDFGLTRGFLSREQATQGGRGLSPGYAPPEQYKGQTLTPATDVYGLAATMFTVLAGTKVPDAPSRLQGTPLPELEILNPSVSSRTVQALAAGLELELRQRPPGISEFFAGFGLEALPKGQVFKARQASLVRRQRAHQAGTQLLCLHAGRLYSTGGIDGCIRLWSWPELEPLSQVVVHPEPVVSLALSPDGKFLVSCSKAGEVHLLSSDLQGPSMPIYSHRPCTRLTFHPQRAILAAAYLGGECALFGPELPEPLRWTAHQGATSSVDFHPNGHVLATAGGDATLKLWDLASFELVATFKGHTKSLTRALFSPDGATLLSASSDQTLRYWELSQLESVREIKNLGAVLIDCAYSPDPNLVLALTGSRQLKAVELAGGRPLMSLETHADWAKSLVCDPLLKLVAVGGQDPSGDLAVWDFSEL